MELEQKPRLKAMCLFVNDGKLLAAKGEDKEKNEIFYRVIGGSVNFGEKSEDAIRREVKEELGCEIEGLELIKVLENIFVFNGKNGHDIVFLFKGELSNKELYKQEQIRIIEPYAEFNAEWVPMDGSVIIYPAFDYKNLLSRF